MTVRLVHKNGLYIANCGYDDRHIPAGCNFDWNKTIKRWVTNSPLKAYQLFEYADKDTQKRLTPIHANYLDSFQTEPVFDYDLDYYPFQAAGIESMVRQLKAKQKKAVLCADQQGLGKTISSLGVANEMGYQKLMVICPASLRLNWYNEIKKWHVHDKGVEAVLSGKDPVPTDRSIITSYNLADKLNDSAFTPDVIIVDEMHYLKNFGAKRTKLILGDSKDDYPGLIRRAPVIELSGTPTPNGRPNELWPSLFRLYPRAINHMKYWTFVKHFCTWEDTGQDIKITGAKNHKELNARLRGSGFMLRRYKKDVLKDLPPKQYKMVVFPQTARTHAIIEKEQDFSVDEIMQYGGSAVNISGLPEVRREMGTAKLPQSLEYITDFLKGGDSKVVVFAHHVEVVTELETALKKFGAVSIRGATTPKKRQQYVDAFQKDENIRVFIGNEAAEEGWTLTAANDVVLVEPEWVPGQNEQRADRLHRIGQLGQVNIHVLVVEESLDSKVLSSAAHKAEDIEDVLGIF